MCDCDEYQKELRETMIKLDAIKTILEGGSLVYNAKITQKGVYRKEGTPSLLIANCDIDLCKKSKRK